jgi:hypothetical protein
MREEGGPRYQAPNFSAQNAPKWHTFFTQEIKQPNMENTIFQLNCVAFSPQANYTDRATAASRRR